VTFADLNTANGSATSGLFENLDSSSLGDDADATHSIAGLSFDTVTLATDAMTMIDQAITRVNDHRATLGATINRLEYAADNLSNVAQNTSASRSRVMDADYASETTELARTQIIQQAATAMLSQANQQAQSVLALLR
jgi:flagellin